MSTSLFQVIVLFWMVGCLAGQYYDDFRDYNNLHEWSKTETDISQDGFQSSYTAEAHGPVGHAPAYDWTALKDVVIDTARSVLRETKMLIANIDHEFEARGDVQIFFDIHCRKFLCNISTSDKWEEVVINGRVGNYL